MNLKSWNKLWLLLFLFNLTFASDNMRIFSIANYSQEINYWISPTSSNYTMSLVDSKYQLERFNQFKSTLYGTGGTDNSPWSMEYVNFILHGQGEKSIYLGEKSQIESFNNQNLDERHIGFGQNNLKYPNSWIKAIANNIDVSQFKHIEYNSLNRAITLDNVLIRVLPTNDPFFLNSAIAGEGYPFDQLQMSSLFAGSAVYILGVSRDRGWSLILSTSCIGWVRSNTIAKVNNQFIATWQKNANINLVGFVDNNVAVVDKIDNYRFSGYVGMVLPAMPNVSENKKVVEVLFPVRQINGFAAIDYTSISLDKVAFLPLKMTPENFAKLIKANQARPYGWGNLGFYNDCSSEMKSIFAMFGIFLPRNSRSQLLAGKVVDLKDKSAKERRDYLLNKGLAFLTLVHIKGHVFLYLGSHNDANGTYPISYQAMWGLKPQDSSSRSVIGQTVIFPLLLRYPEDKNVVSQLNNAAFDVVFLNQWPVLPLKQGLSQLFY